MNAPFSALLSAYIATSIWVLCEEASLASSAASFASRAAASCERHRASCAMPALRSRLLIKPRCPAASSMRELLS
eukprot:scaffold10709_cov59-Phaeocystis_antarctica.AAC.1